MFGKKNGTFFGSNGAMANVVGNTAFVSGAGEKDGVYTQVGNTVFGPNGVSTVMGTGSNKTIIGPDGVSTVFNNGAMSTIIGPDGVHTVIHNPTGGTVI